MDPKALASIERKNYLLGGVLVVLALVWGTQEQIVGVVAGVVLSSLNFSFVRKLVEKVMAEKTEDRARVVALFVPKMAVLMVSVALVLYFLPVSPIAFAVGFSVFLASVAVESARFVLAADRTSDDSSESQEHD